MKLEEYDCVKIKRRAQTRIYEETKNLTPAALVAHYQRIAATARQRQTELRARPQPASPSAMGPRGLSPTQLGNKPTSEILDSWTSLKAGVKLRE